LIQNIRDTLIKSGLKSDEIRGNPTELWTGDSSPTTKIVQANGTNPRIRDYSEVLVTSYASALDDNPGVKPRYIARIWIQDSLRSLIDEKVWFWISRDSVEFEKFRPLIVRSNQTVETHWTIILGETKKKWALP
jgi:hypothetical protein